MATASINHMVLWTDLEGTELSGRWTLVRQVRSEGRTGWFEAKDAEGRPVMLIITETLNDEEELMDRLRAAAAIRHPNVVRIEDSLVVDLEDTPMVVAATELTEENLADVLRERTLGAEEARQVFDALLAGLAAVHGKGLVHGRMEPGSVLATGETIKLRSDCVHEGGANFATAAGEDVRGLARIISQAMTRRIPAGENDPVLQLVPEPMARAVRRALSGRATVDEIATLAGIRIVPPPPVAAAPKPQVKLEKPVSAPQPAAPVEEVKQSAPETPAAGTSQPTAPASEVAETAPAEPLRIVAAAAVSAPAAAEKPAPQAVETPSGVMEEPKSIGRTSSLLVEDDEPAWDRRRFAPWIVVAAVALIVITAFVLYGMLHHRPSRPAAALPPAMAAPVHRAPAAGKAVAEGAANGPAAAMAAPAGPGWRVITYTYDHQKDADRKAQLLQQRFPNLHADVFAPRGRGPYLVTLGGVMSRPDALSLRQKAVRMGLPHDTYVQNFR